jgi:predicted outer membrane repeat protein
MYCTCPFETSSTLTNCTFIDNTAGSRGGGVYAWGSPALTDCEFLRNQAEDGGGLCEGGTWPVLTNCKLVDNVASGYGGGMCYEFGYGRCPTLTNCTAVGNDAGTHGGAIYCDGLMGSADAAIANCIVALNGGGGWALAITDDSDISCTDVWGNEGGDDFWCDHAGIFCEDPVFCLDDNPDEPYSLREGSPCLPENSPCGELVGALGQGCEALTLVEDTSWAAIKAMYR